MAELHFKRYLQKEEKLILSILSICSSHLNKLKVEELNIRSAIREKHFQKIMGAANQVPPLTERIHNIDLATVNMEHIDLSVRHELNLLARASFTNFEDEVEENDDYET